VSKWLTAHGKVGMKDEEGEKMPPPPMPMLLLLLLLLLLYKDDKNQSTF
jgi:hypothetical protein